MIDFGQKNYFTEMKEQKKVHATLNKLIINSKNRNVLQLFPFPFGVNELITHLIENDMQCSTVVRNQLNINFLVDFDLKNEENH